MKKYIGLLAILFVTVCCAKGVSNSNKLVILHTNDTHSQIETSANGVGGILQIKAILDSVTKAEKNVMRIDAGDMVQGSLYFKFFRGDVEYPLFNLMDYDIRILGNHEFDNGMEDLEKRYKEVKATPLSANYDFSNTGLKDVFLPYTIKKIGNKKVGFIGLNVKPDNLISKKNYEGMTFKEIIPTANELASMLKKEKGCDVIIAVTHIGYTTDNPGETTDPILAAESRDIDVIIGGHSHTTLDPANPKEDLPILVNNLDGKPVLIAQTGKYGRYVGKIEIDLNNPADKKSSLIPVTDRFPKETLDKKMGAIIDYYREKVDSVNRHVIAHSLMDMPSGRQVGAYPNWTADFAKWYGDLVLDSIGGINGKKQVDLAIMNVGGIRMDMKKGDVTEGQILNTFPFSNLMTITEVSGDDLFKAMQASAAKGGEAISANVRVVVDKDGKVQNVIIDNKPIDLNAKYLVSTIDYLAEGNDYLTSLANGIRKWTDDREMAAPLLRYVIMQESYGLPLSSDPNPRFIFN